MRGVIHQKIEQLFCSSTLWNTIMPVKIFSDLVSFVGENNYVPQGMDPLVRTSINPNSALSSLNKSFDSI